MNDDDVNPFNDLNDERTKVNRICQRMYYPYIFQIINNKKEEEIKIEGSLVIHTNRRWIKLNQSIYLRIIRVDLMVDCT